jgi:hypothetical protein
MCMWGSLAWVFTTRSLAVIVTNKAVKIKPKKTLS